MSAKETSFRIMMLINEWEAMERGNKIAHINVLSESVNVCSSNLSVAFGFQSQHNNFIPYMYTVQQQWHKLYCCFQGWIYKIVDTSEWFKRHQNSVLNLTHCSLIYTTKIFPCESLLELMLRSKLKTKYVSDNAWIAFEMFVQDDNWSWRKQCHI